MDHVARRERRRCAEPRASRFEALTRRFRPLFPPGSTRQQHRMRGARYFVEIAEMADGARCRTMRAWRALGVSFRKACHSMEMDPVPELSASPFVALGDTRAVRRRAAAMLSSSDDGAVDSEEDDVSELRQAALAGGRRALTFSSVFASQTAPEESDSSGTGSSAAPRVPPAAPPPGLAGTHSPEASPGMASPSRAVLAAAYAALQQDVSEALSRGGTPRSSPTKVRGCCVRRPLAN